MRADFDGRTPVLGRANRPTRRRSRTSQFGDGPDRTDRLTNDRADRWSNWIGELSRWTAQTSDRLTPSLAMVLGCVTGRWRSMAMMRGDWFSGPLLSRHFVDQVLPRAFAGRLASRRLMAVIGGCGVGSRRACDARPGVRPPRDLRCRRRAAVRVPRLPAARRHAVAPTCRVSRACSSAHSKVRMA